MKRVATLGVFVSCLLFLSAIGSGVAGRTAANAPQVKDKSVTWRALNNGVELLPLYETPGIAAWPQIAVLRMPEAEYTKFAAGPEEYVNGQHVFPIPVRKVAQQPFCCPPNKGADRMVVLMHCKDSSTCSLCSRTN